MLPFSETIINDPAAADVRPRPAAVGEAGGVGAAGLFQGVGQDRQAVEGAVVVDGLRQLWDSAVLPRQPGGVGNRRAEWVAENIAEDWQRVQDVGMPVEEWVPLGKNQNAVGDIPVNPTTS